MFFILHNRISFGRVDNLLYDKSNMINQVELKLTRRKPSVRHWVTAHGRGGKPVSGYYRGSGAESKRPSKVVGSVVHKDSTLGDLTLHEVVMAKDRATAWWRPDADTIVYWKRDWETKDGEDIWVWDGPFVLKGYEKESMDGRRLGTFTDVKSVERKISRFKY